MPQWTLLGLMQGKQTAPWPWRKERMARTAFSACRATSRHFATDECQLAPTSARPRRSPCGPATRRVGSTGYRLRPLRRLPALHRGLSDRRHGDVFRLGLRCRTREDLIWNDGPIRTRAAGEETRHAFRRSLHIRHVDAGSCNGCEVGTAGVEQSILQSASAWHFLHRVAAFRRSSVGDRAGHLRHARPLARHLRSDGGAALGDGGRHLRCLRRHRGGRLCLRTRLGGRSSRRCLSARMPSQPGGDHACVADVSRPRAAAGERRTACRMSCLTPAFIAWVSPPRCFTQRTRH